MYLSFCICRCPCSSNDQSKLKRIASIQELLLDFSKAFDLINHNALLQNLPQHPAGTTSTEEFHKAQSCTFLLIINYLKTACVSYKYIDDMSIVYTGHQVPTLQEAAHVVYSWTTQNDMKINQNKTKELIDFSKKTRKDFHPIHINGRETQRVIEAKVLGITIISNLSWDVHVGETAVKDLLAVYLTVVWPTLEYLTVVWPMLEYLTVVWPTLEYLTVVWPMLEYLTVVWPTLEYLTVVWPTLEYLTVVWPTLEYACPAWSTHTGSAK